MFWKSLQPNFLRILAQNIKQLWKLIVFKQKKVKWIKDAFRYKID